MKRYIVLVLLFVVFKLGAQQFTGEIFIQDNSALYLNQVYVTNLKTQKTILADFSGKFSIPANAGDPIRFTSIVTERKDIITTPQQLSSVKNMVELKIAYYEIQEVIISRFKPTGNLTYDVNSLKTNTKVAQIKKMIGLPEAKGNGQSPQLPVAGFRDGGLTFSLESIFDILSGERKKKERYLAYETMTSSIENIKNYMGKSYFESIKIPENLVDNFLQFVYSSDNLAPYVQKGNYEIVKLSIEKYLPVYQKRLQNSHLLDVVKPLNKTVQTTETKIQKVN